MWTTIHSNFAQLFIWASVIIVQLRRYSIFTCTSHSQLGKFSRSPLASKFIEQTSSINVLLKPISETAMKTVWIVLFPLCQHPKNKFSVPTKHPGPKQSKAKQNQIFSLPFLSPLFPFTPFLYPTLFKLINIKIKYPTFPLLHNRNHLSKCV